MQLGRLMLRATVSGVFVVHGTQKLFGWFGGYGLDGTGQFFESLGLRPGRRHALAAGATETGGGILMAGRRQPAPPAPTAPAEAPATPEAPPAPDARTT